MVRPWSAATSDPRLRDNDLGGGAGDLADEAWDEIAGQAGAQLVHDLERSLLIDLEVGGAGDPVEEPEVDAPLVRSKVVFEDDPADLDAGYQLAGDKHKEGKCGEGKCGGEKKAEGACGGEKKAEGKCGEGKCGGEKKAEGSCGGSH